MNILEKIAAGAYSPKSSIFGDYATLREERSRLREQFKSDLEAEFNTPHEYAADLFNNAEGIAAVDTVEEIYHRYVELRNRRSA